MTSTVGYIQNLQENHLPLMSQLWPGTFNNQNVTRSILFEKTFGAFDYAPELCFGYFDDDGLAGFICGTPATRPGRAGIRLLIVAPARRRRGIGTMLLSEFENRLRAQGSISHIRAVATPGNYLTPGVNPFDMDFTCFLEVHNYHWVGTSQNLLAESTFQRRYQDRLESILKSGYTLRRADSNDDRLLEFVKEQFPSWLHEVRRSLLNSPVTIHVCEAGGEAVGFACSESNNVGSGVLGPTGVHPAHRGHGISQVTLHLCVDDLRCRGFERYILGWTNPDLNCFFRREFGAERSGVYWIYEKAIA